MIYAFSVFLVSIIISRPLQTISANKASFHLLTAICLMFMLLTVFTKSPTDISYMSSKLVDMPVLPTKEYAAKSGFKMRVPLQGDQVGNAGLPSTPYPRDNIVLRKEGLAGGFRTVLP